MKKRDILLALILILVLLFVFLPHASDRPDGLERAAEDLGFMKKTATSDFSLLTGVAGVMLVFLLGSALGILVRRLSSKN